MALINSQDMAQVVGLKRAGIFSAVIGWVLLRLIRINKINKIYDRVKKYRGEVFFEKLLDEFSIRYEVSEEDLKRIPNSGPFIVVANHPLGGADGIILLALLTKLRPDFKITGNFLLEKVEPISPYIINVNPFENRKDIKKKLNATQLSLEHLKEGGALGFFPAGEVSNIKKGRFYIDKNWHKGVAKIVKKAQVPVVPIYFHAKNSRLFYFLSSLSPLLQTAKLPSELIKKRIKPIKMRIGNAIPAREFNDMNDLDEISDYLRKKTYLLANAYNAHINPLLSAKEKIKIPKKPKKITKAQDIEDIKLEIEALRQSEKRLLEVSNYEVFIAKSKNIPYTLHEIGRLREITFREVGEGTNKKIDLDKFDNYYHHMFLWDQVSERIVGAYRMGLGLEIFPKYGAKGFYISTLFRFDQELNPMLSKTIEMGRAFIIKEYQQKPMPLFLLWKGIVHVTLRYNQHHFLMGGVSISNKFSNFSKSVMIDFMKTNYYDLLVAQYIKPKKDYKVKLKDEDKNFIFSHTKRDIKKLDKFLAEIEPEDLHLPVLIKKYIKQNAKIIGFNVDPKFNNAIDGLMYIRIDDLPEETVKPVLEEYQQILLKKNK